MHPAGTLGKKLTLRVEDLMHRGAENPLVRDDRRVTDALAIMTRTRLGAASVVDARGRLVGVFTDGDLRRKLQKDPRSVDPPSVADHDAVAPHGVGPTGAGRRCGAAFPQIRVGQFSRGGRAAAAGRASWTKRILLEEGLV